MNSPASVANKRLTAWLTPLAATLTKNRGVGSEAAFLPSSTDMPPLSFHTLTNCNSSNPFVFIFMQIDGGVHPPCTFTTFRSLCKLLFPESSRFIVLALSASLLTFNFRLSTFSRAPLFPRVAGHGPRDTPHDPATHVQPHARPQDLHGKRADRKNPRPPRQKLHRHFCPGRNLQLPRSPVRPHLFHFEGRPRAGSLR